MDLLHAIILAVVEGLTEYLPVSSTGHIILTSAFLGINENEFVKDYTVIVQFGAILSVVALYWRDLIRSVELYKKLLVAFLPAGVIGFALKDIIQSWLGSVTVVAFSLLIGGIALLLVDKWLEKKEQRELLQSTDKITLKDSLIIGVIQCAALVPGVSRSASTIIGGLVRDLDRKTAAEFSFLLAVPTLGAATAYKLLKIAPHITSADIRVIVIGNIVSFIVGAITIKTFVKYLSRYGFKVFGYYRIAVGTVLLILIALGVQLKDL
jgi:undecaprenyl-diphosphatase